MSVQVCSKCTKSNSREASYCFDCGALLAGHTGAAAAAHPGRQPFPNAFVFPSGQACQNFDQLATTCQQNWSAAVDFLKKGFFASFFGGLGRADLAAAAQESANFPDADRGLDQLLEKLPTDVLKKPKLEVEPTTVNLGQVKLGTDRSFKLDLHNQGMRLLYGSVAADCKWLTLGELPGTAQRLFQFGDSTTIPVQVRGKQLRAGTKPLEGHLVIESNGGTVTVKVRADVPIIPFGEGVLAGATSPRQIAEKARGAPQQAAPLFENGAVGEWFTSNGWTYPVQGPAASGLGAVQQFFEALGLAKAPRVEVKTPAINLRGNPGDRLETKIEVSTPERRPVYAYANSDEAWLDVSKTKLNGRFATIAVVVSSVPNSPGQVLQTRIRVTGNGNQRFEVPLSITVEGTPLPVKPDSDGGFMSPPPLPAPPPLPPRSAPPPADDDSPFGGIAPSRFGGGADTEFPTTSPSEGVVAPASLKAATSRKLPFWAHIIPLAVLAVAVLGIMGRDFLLSNQTVVEAPPDSAYPLLKLNFDNPLGTPKLTFGLEMRDPEDDKNWVKLTFNDKGHTNSTVIRVEEKQKGKETFKLSIPAEGKNANFYSPSRRTIGMNGMEGAWVSNESIKITQSVELIPGNPIEVASGETKRFYDTCLVRYRLENTDPKPDAPPRKVGLRVLLDTYIGNNDGPSFAIPGMQNLISAKHDFPTPESIPDFIQALERPNVKEPGIVAQLTFRLGPNLERPSRVSLTHWPGMPNANPEYNINTYQIKVEDIIPVGADGIPGAPDSAVVMYWPDVEMKPGQVRTLGFTYGVGKMASKSGLGLSIDGDKSPGGEMTVIALVNDPKPDQTLTLVLPKEMELTSGAETQPVPPSAKGGPSPVTWKVRSTAEGLYQIRVEESIDGVRERRFVKIQQSKIF